MESLGRMQDTLPGSEAAEKELQASFRSAALALTSLFKQGKKSANKAYISGKREALQDVLEFLQASLDHPPPAAHGAAAGPLNVARLIDYICARQETLKAEEEGEDDDDSTAATAPTPTVRSTSSYNRSQQPSQAQSRAAMFAALSSRTGGSNAQASTSASAPVTRPSSVPPPAVSTSLPVNAPGVSTPRTRYQPQASTSTPSSASSSPAFSRVASAPSRENPAGQYAHHQQQSSSFGSPPPVQTRATTVPPASMGIEPSNHVGFLFGTGAPLSPLSSSTSSTPVSIHGGSHSLAPSASSSAPTMPSTRRRGPGSGTRESSRKPRNSIARDKAARNATVVPVHQAGVDLAAGGAGSTEGAVTGAGPASGVSGKRRWANVAMAEVNLDDGNEAAAGIGSDSDSDVVVNESTARGGAGTLHGESALEAAGGGGGSGGVEAGGTGDDSMEMEMDGWNGLGERPSKRLARASLR